MVHDPRTLNRSVHLGRRDALVERAVELLGQPVDHLEVGGRLQHVRTVMEYLERALREQELAARGHPVAELERDFIRFLRLMLDNVRSAAAFLEQQAHLEASEDSFLSSFLGVSRDEITLSAINYRRLALDVLSGLWQLLRLLYVPYRKLRELNDSELSDEDRARYQLAHETLGEELRASAPGPSAPH